MSKPNLQDELWFSVRTQTGHMIDVRISWPMCPAPISDTSRDELGSCSYGVDHLARERERCMKLLQKGLRLAVMEDDGMAST